jgi:hypothetical protein
LTRYIANLRRLALIAQAGGAYLVGLKDNQKELKKQIKQAIENQAVLFRSSGVEKDTDEWKLGVMNFTICWRWKKPTNGKCVK